MVVLADSSVWVDTLAEGAGAHVDALLRASALGVLVVGDLVLTEVLHGIRQERRFRETRIMMSRFQQVQLMGSAVAIQSAANYRLLRSRGITVRGTIDVIIATWCIENDAAIIHNDRDMRIMEEQLGLRVYS